jgi:AcrR family transcriptional regulator
MTTSPGLRERKKAKTRRTIQDHALRLFAEQGYDATTVDQIAEAAEISPSTFFRYFATKEDLVIEDEYDPMVVELFLAQPPSLGPVAAMRQAMRTAFNQIYSTEQGQLLQRTKLQLEVPAIRAKALNNQFNMANAVTHAAAARYRRDVDDYAVQVFAAACVGALIPAITRWAASDGKEPLPELVDSALALLESGLDLK